MSVAILDSHLYKLLKYWQRFDNGFNNINEIYFFIYGYDSFMHQSGVEKLLHEEWISDFYIFISEELKDLFYPDEEVKSAHFGIIINEYVKDKEKGIKLFYQILDNFMKKRALSNSNKMD